MEKRKTKSKTSKRDIIPEYELEIQEFETLSLDSQPKEFKPINEKESKNYKRKSPLYFKKKLRRNVSQKFKPEEEADAIPLYEKDEEHFNEEEQKVTEYDDSEEERTSPINDIRKKRGDSPLMYSQNQRDKLVRERNKKSGKMVPFGGKKKKTLRRKPRKQSGQNLVTKRVKTKKNKRYYTKK